MLLTALLLTAVLQDPGPASAPGQHLKALIDFSALCRPAAEGEGLEVFSGRTAAAGADLFRLDGAGVIRRIWLPRASGELRFYFGGAQEPALRLDLADPGALPAFAGRLVSRAGGSLDSLVPVPFADGVRVSCSEAGLDFRVEVQTAAGPEGLAPADAGFWSRQAEAYDLVSGMLGRGEFLLQPRRRTTTIGRVQTNSQISGQIRGRGTVHRFRLEITNAADLDLDQLYRGLRLRVIADKERQVDVPLGDFFGASSALPAGASHLTRVSYDPGQGLVLESYLPLPFSDGIRVEVHNEAFEVPLCRFNLYWSDADLGPWRLHSGWKLERGLQGATSHRLLDADGPGRLIGAGVAIKGGGFGGAVDPSGFFGLPPGELVPGRRPFQGVGSGNGWVSFDRLLPGAGIPFDGPFQFDLPLELGSEPVDVASIVWWYAPAGAGHRLGELPDAPERSLR